MEQAEITNENNTETVELSLNDVLPIGDAAKLLGCTVEIVLRQAANEERLLYVALKAHSTVLVAIPSHPNPRTMQRTNKQVLFVVMAASYVETLATFGSVEIGQYQASFNEDVLDWHYWMLDVPQEVDINRIYVPLSQLPADAPAEKVEAGASPSGDEIPGKMPRTAIGRLAIKAAWHIECATRKRATANQVISKLVDWIESEPLLNKKIPHGIQWITTNNTEADFSIEACGTALKKWNLTRP